MGTAEYDSDNKQDSNYKSFIIRNVIISLLILIIGGLSSFYNESTILNKKLTISEEVSHVTPIDPDKVEINNNGKLVYLTGKVSSPHTLSDNDFGITVDAIHLKRSVEIYQWVEKKVANKEKKSDKNEEPENKYQYNKEWKSGIVSHHGFHDSTGHINPDKVLYSSKWFIAENVHLGKYSLDDVFVNKINFEEPLKLNNLNLNAENQKLKIEGKYLFIGNGNIENPQIGDLKITFYIVKPQDISIIGKQKNSKIITYITSSKRKINIVEKGIVPSYLLFKSEINNRKLRYWTFRILSFILLFTGFLIFYNPISTRIKRFKIGKLKFSLIFSILSFSIIMIMVWILYVWFTGIVSIVISILMLLLFIISKPNP